MEINRLRIIIDDWLKSHMLTSLRVFNRTREGTVPSLYRNIVCGVLFNEYKFSATHIAGITRMHQTSISRYVRLSNDMLLNREWYYIYKEFCKFLKDNGLKHEF